MDDKHVDLILTNSEDGDQYRLYVDGKLFTEGHSISDEDWINLICEHKHFSGKCKNLEFSEDEMEDMGCSFPYDIKEIPFVSELIK